MPTKKYLDHNSRVGAAHKLKPLSETPPKPDFWPSSAVYSLITSRKEDTFHRTESCLMYSFLMSGTSIVSKWHLVSTRNLHCLIFHHIPHLVSAMIGTEGPGQAHDMHV